jgi:hypothetical protein
MLERRVAAYGSGKIEEVLRAADERGSLTVSEITEILDTRELPIEYESRVSIGERSD